jgi:hypothetical protein
MDLYHGISLMGQGKTGEAASRLRDLAKADTYEDIKAEAHYHLALHVLAGEPPDRELAMGLLKKSVDYYAQPKPLVEAARCALLLRKVEDARLYLDRCMREFPHSEKETKTRARQLLDRVVEAEAAKNK